MWAMKDTTLANAFAKVGIRSAADRLREVARDALAKHPRTLDAAREMVLRAVASDASLLWTLFEPWHRPAVHALLSEVAATARAGLGEAAQANRTGAREAAQTTEAAPHQAGGLPASGALAAQVEAARQTVARVLSKLDFFKVNGRPIGDCTPQEVFAWSDHHSRDVRFARALAANLPPDRPIRQFVKPDEADALYERITQEMRNA